MRIGVDATCWRNNRGYGRHARALLSALVRLDSESHYAFFLDAADGAEDGAEALPPQAEARVVRATAPAAIAASANGHRSLGDMWRMSRALSDPALDLLLFPTIYSYVPVFSRARKIVMIHDVIAETYPQLTLPHPLARLFWRAKVAMGRRQADAIVTISEYSRQGIARQFNLPLERIFVVGEASDPIFRRLPDARLTPRLEALGVSPDNRTIVYVGGFSPHKNLEPLVAAFAKLARQPALSDIRLVMVGEYEKEVFHSYFSVIKQQAEEQSIASRVIFTGYLPDEELVVLLNCATALALPSLIEGFGLPAVEAAACGCPVIATAASPLPELLGEGGIFIDPHNPVELEEALARVLELESLRRRMSEAGMAAAGCLTWDAAARQMMTLIQHVAAQ